MVEMKILMETGDFVREESLNTLKKKHSDVAFQIQSMEVSEEVTDMVKKLEIEISRLIRKMSDISESNKSWEKDRLELEDLNLSLEGLFECFLVQADLDDKDTLVFKTKFKEDNTSAISSIVQRLLENHSAKTCELEERLVGMNARFEQQQQQFDANVLELEKLKSANETLESQLQNANSEINVRFFL